jgi:hypothetical protein
MWQYPKRSKKTAFGFIRRLYEKIDGSTFTTATSGEIGHELGWSDERTDRAVEYLVDHGLVKHVSLGGEISLEHAGVLEVESAWTNPSLDISRRSSTGDADLG